MGRDDQVHAPGLRRRRSRLSALTLVVILVLGVATPAVSLASSGFSAQPLLFATVPHSSTVYVAAAGQCLNASCLELFRTTTAGGGFTREALPPVAPASGSVTGTLSRLDFASVDVGFALLEVAGSPRLYATSNGARSWHRWKVDAPGVVESVAVTPRELYLEVADCAVTVPYCDNFRIVRSPVTGAHWTSTPIPTSASSAEGSFFGPIAAVGDDVWATETGSRAFVVRSLDEGHHFTLIAAPQLLSVTGCALTAFSATRVWAQCPTGMQEVFWFTSNVAKSWTYVDTPRPVYGTGGGLFDPVSATLAYLAGGASFDSLLRITGGARHVAVAGRLECPSLLGLAFSDQDHGLAACSSYSTSYLEVTANGGATWHRVAVTAS